jgi:hypothetical protein
METAIYNLYINLVYLPFVSLLKFLESNPNYFYVLIVLFIVLIYIKGKLFPPKIPAVPIQPDPNAKEKIPDAPTPKPKLYARVFPNVLDFLTIFTLILILFVGYHNYGPAISDFLKTSDTKVTPAAPATTPGTNQTPSTQTTPKQTTPTYQAPKQLYYAVSCYGCWADSCPRDGYSYGGYEAYYYSYYKALCDACNCNSSKSQSFWK